MMKTIFVMPTIVRIKVKFVFHSLSFLLILMLTLPVDARQEESENLPIYRLVRSLQFVQDTIVGGDHSAMEMQRFLLQRVDLRMRAARPEEFDDPRNVDAALIYAMSGGNPKTLDLLVARDRYGYFDEEITKIMRAYLNGLIPAIEKPIEEIVWDYLNTPLGAYLALVGANMKAASNDMDAIKLFDLARLAAPGTLVEESALRRSILMTINNNQVDEAVRFAHIYARRFSGSPYNVQFSQLVIEMIVNNLNNIDEILVDEIISYLPVSQQKRIYLRIARTGVVEGNKKMAIKAYDKIPTFEGTNMRLYEMLARFYANISNLPDAETMELLNEIRSVKRRSLSPIDQPLYDAALITANEILYMPTEESLAQAANRIVEQEEIIDLDSAKSINLKDFSDVVEEKVDTAPQLPGDEEFSAFMEQRASALEEVDALLAPELDAEDEES